MNDWREFINGTRMEPPGEICNNILLEDGVPKKNLKLKVHYRGINAEVWNYFFNIYGGGPPIIRRTMDIYDEPISLDDIKNFENTSKEEVNSE